MVNRALIIIFATILIGSSPAIAKMKGKIEPSLRVIDGLIVNQVEDPYLKTLIEKGLVLLDSELALTKEKSQLYLHDLMKGRLASKIPMSAPKSCEKYVKITEPGRRLAALYCFGSKSGKSGLLQIYQGQGNFIPILKTPYPIRGVTGGGNRLFFLCRDTIYQLRLGEEIRPIFVSPFLDGAQSLAFDSERDVLFVSTKDEIYSLRSGTLDLLAQGIGGDLNWVNENLSIITKTGIYLLSGTRQLLSKSK